MKLPKWLVLFGIVLCLAVMCFSGYQVFNILADYRAGDAINEMVQQYADLEPPQKSEFPIPEATVEAGTPIAESEVDPVVYPQVDFDSLLQINSDVVGWIYIEDTAINYPIVLGEDNEKYVRTSVDGKYSYYGSIFMDYRKGSFEAIPNYSIQGTGSFRPGSYKTWILPEPI